MKTKTLSASVAGCLLAAALAGFVPGACLAQAAAGAKPPAPARAAPRPDDIEPGVDTSADQHPGQVRDNTPGSSAAAAASAAPAGDPAPASNKPAKKGAKGKAGAKGADPATDKPGKPTAKTEDRMDLDRTQITGNRELPKVMVIVPWKHSDLGDLGKPMNSLVNEVLQPIDRDVFERQTRYYEALKPDAAASAAR